MVCNDQECLPPATQTLFHCIELIKCLLDTLRYPYAKNIKLNKILVIGASGQIGTELTLALRQRYGGEMVIAADLKREADLLKGTGPFLPLDIMDKEILRVQVRRHEIKTIYLLVAMLSAAGEKNPMLAWHLNMQSLIHTLEVAREEGVKKVFWPSSIAVFGAGCTKGKLSAGCLCCPINGLRD